LLNTVDRIRDPTGVATEVVGMEERRARLRQATAASRRRGDHRAKEEERARLGLKEAEQQLLLCLLNSNRRLQIFILLASIYKILYLRTKYSI